MTERVNLRPQRLRERMERWNIKLPPYAATWDRVFVYPLDDKTGGETVNGVQTSTHKTKGGLLVPIEAGQVYAAQVGVIVSMGPKAIEQCYSVGICIGDIVVTNRLSRWEKRYFAEGREHRILLVTAGELTGSDDLARALEVGEIWYEMDSATGEVTVNTSDGPMPIQPAPPLEYGV